MAVIIFSSNCLYFAEAETHRHIRGCNIAITLIMALRWALECNRLLSGFDLKQNGTTPNRAINKIAAMSAPARYVLTMFFVSGDYRARAAGHGDFLV